MSKAIRRSERTKSGYNGGDIDELIVLFRAGLVWDGNHPSKNSRDHLAQHVNAVKCEGFTALTGKGKLAALFCWPMPRVWLQMLWRRRGTEKEVFNLADQSKAYR